MDNISTRSIITLLRENHTDIPHGNALLVDTRALRNPPKTPPYANACSTPTASTLKFAATSWPPAAPVKWSTRPPNESAPP
ncbi:hypothetical protein [Streptomyces sp. Wb2n-11]|uniref:hypothetical protein n=1 Tax=Streptomyces sp. Wb2n-11 TaxID=1030533 RepID=UPI000AF98E38|nr:hypothetical protein [Streptomyces sp. Wb2n-11]